MEKTNEFEAKRDETILKAVESVKLDYLENIPEYSLAMRKIEKKGTYSDKLLEDSVNIYSYIAKEFNVNTLTDARKCIEEGKISPDIIKLWIDEGMFGIDMHLSNAVFIGYPDFEDILKQKISEVRKILKLENEKRKEEEAAEAEEDLKLIQ